MNPIRQDLLSGSHNVSSIKLCVVIGKKVNGAGRRTFDCRSRGTRERTKGFAKAAASGELPEFSAVIACDKREAFAQGSNATKQSIYPRAERWIASRACIGAHCATRCSQ